MICSATAPIAVIGGATRGTTFQGSKLSTRGLSGVVHYEPAALTLVVGAGTPVAEVEALLASEGQRLAFEPTDPRVLSLATGTPTIGGMVAMNDFGPRKVQVGSCRDFVIGAHFVDGGGRIVKSGGRVMKNVTGYDLARLMCGARGTLGVLTEVAFKVLPMPETQTTLRLKADILDAPAIMAVALGTPWEVSGAAWLNGEIWLRIEGFADQINYRTKRLAAALSAFGEFAIDPDADWTLVRDGTPLADVSGDLWRITCRPSQAAHILTGLDTSAVILDHGGATITLRTTPGTDLRQLFPALTAECLSGLFAALPSPSAAVNALHLGLKAKFDPKNLFGQL
jgi:glycolate oxidase FAD binding subunit